MEKALVRNSGDDLFEVTVSRVGQVFEVPPFRKQSGGASKTCPTLHKLTADQAFQDFDAAFQRSVLGCETDAEMRVFLTEDFAGDDQ